MGYGTITAHALMSLEARGVLFVTPGMEVSQVNCSFLAFFFGDLVFPATLVWYVLLQMLLTLRSSIVAVHLTLSKNRGRKKVHSFPFGLCVCTIVDNSELSNQLFQWLFWILVCITPLFKTVTWLNSIHTSHATMHNTSVFKF